jgi:hypothetical protein
MFILYYKLFILILYKIPKIKDKIPIIQPNFSKILLLTAFSSAVNRYFCQIVSKFSFFSQNSLYFFINKD